MKRVALTFIGKDRTGIIAEISRVLFNSGCNIEDTTMTILEGEFAMILIALLPGSRIEKTLKEEYDRLKTKWGLYHFWKILPEKKISREKHPEDTKTYIVSVMGRDRTGIVYETSRILAGYGFNITDLNSKILGSVSKPVFAMILEADVPKRFSIKKLETSLGRLKHKLDVDVQIRPLGRLAL